MKKLIPVLLSIIFLVTLSCEKGEYDDNQYGNTCFIRSLSIDKGPTTTFEYDQDDMISSMHSTGEGMPSSKIEFTYNNDQAFADFYIDNQLVGHSTATLDEYSNIVSVQYTHASGEEAAELNYIYDADHRPVSVSAYDFTLDKIETMAIEWHDGNATLFTSATQRHRCTYFKDNKSSLKVGKGNVFLQAAPEDANIGMFLSVDQMETYNADAEGGMEALHIIYEADSDGKIRKIFWSTTASNQFGTTEVEYDCHD